MLKYLTALACVVILGVTSLCMESEKKESYAAKSNKNEVLQQKGLNPKNTCQQAQYWVIMQFCEWYNIDLPTARKCGETKAPLIFITIEKYH